MIFHESPKGVAATDTPKIPDVDTGADGNNNPKQRTSTSHDHL